MAHDLDTVSNPCPIVTEAAALQLLANASGNRIRITRTDNAVDLSMEDMTSGQYDYTISDRELYVSPAVDTEDKLREIVVTTHRRGGGDDVKDARRGYPVRHRPYAADGPGVACLRISQRGCWYQLPAIWVRRLSVGITPRCVDDGAV